MEKGLQDVGFRSASVAEMRRRAVQFHYRPSSAPKTSIEERLAIFGSEGKDVTC